MQPLSPFGASVICDGLPPTSLYENILFGIMSLRTQTCEKAMPIGLLRVTAAAALLVCFANGTLPADAGTYRSAPAPGWTNATHRSVSRLPARQVLSGQRFAPAARYSPNGRRGPWRATPPIRKPPGATVITRQVLDDMNATTLRDALRYAPGVTAR
jgi:outer membrane receptor for monomeric catechols